MKTLEGLDANQRAAALVARTGATRVNWQSAGSHKDESGIWRGGVTLGSYGDAAAREFGVKTTLEGGGGKLVEYIKGRKERLWLLLLCMRRTRSMMY